MENGQETDETHQPPANPYGTDGYDVVVDFTTRRVIFSLHRYDES